MIWESSFPAGKISEAAEPKAQKLILTEMSTTNENITIEEESEKSKAQEAILTEMPMRNENTVQQAKLSLTETAIQKEEFKEQTLSVVIASKAALHPELQPDPHGNTPLHLLMKDPFLTPEKIQTLLKSKPELRDAINTQNNAGKTPLDLIPNQTNQENLIKIIECLFENGADPELSTSASGNQFLHRNLDKPWLIYAVLNNVVFFRDSNLYERMINAQNAEGRTPFAMMYQNDNADYENHAAICATLTLWEKMNISQKYQGSLPLHMSLAARDYATSSILIREMNPIPSKWDLSPPQLLQPVVNDQDAEGNTFLHYAVRYSSRDIDALNLDQDWKKMDVYNQLGIYTDSDGWDRLTQRLLRAGADPSIPNKEGLLPIHIAIQENNAEALRVLLKNASAEKIEEFINTPDGDGKTPLTLAKSLFFDKTKERFINEARERSLFNENREQIISLLEFHGAK